MDMLDIFALSGLEWVYDKVQERFGRAAAFLVTGALMAAILGAIITVLKAVL